MRTLILILLGFIISMISIWILGHHIESGDINAISMYIVVYSLPAVGLAVLNGILLKTSERFRNRLFNWISFVLLPIGLLITLLSVDNIRFTFIAEFGSVGIGITNIIWITRIEIMKNGFLNQDK